IGSEQPAKDRESHGEGMPTVLLRNVRPEQVGQLVPVIDLPAVDDQVNQQGQVLADFELDLPPVGPPQLRASQQPEVIGVGQDHSSLECSGGRLYGSARKPPNSRVCATRIV